MNVVGEVQRGRTSWQIDNLTLGGEGVDAVFEQLAADSLQKVPVGVRGALLRLQQAPYPLDLALILGIPGAAFFIGPVGGDAELGVLVHLPGTNLHLDTLARGPHDGGVDGAVEV